MSSLTKAFNTSLCFLWMHVEQTSARSIASQLLTKVNIQDFVRKLQGIKSDELSITFEMIALGVHSIAIDDNARDGDRLKAYDQLAKLFGNYATIKTEVTNIESSPEEKALRLSEILKKVNTK